MYVPQAFRENRAEALADLILSYPFATVMHHHDGELQAEAVPMIPGNDGHLRGHVARANPLVDADDSDVLVIFHGPEAYISPGWYPTKHETGREVPTWNYAMVQAHGRLRVINDRDWLMGLLRDLTDRHEADLPEPWRIDDAPEEHIVQLLNGISGIDIEVERVEGKFKLSQNHPERNRAGVIAGLGERGGERDAALLELMQRYAMAESPPEPDA